MIVLILVLSIIFAIFAHSNFISGLSMFFALAMLVFIFFIGPDVAASSTIDDNIAMYQEENAAIEQSIDRIVEEKDSITLITLIPELQSNTFIQEQLDTYSNNTQQIHWLRDEKIDISRHKWLLYFGK